MRASSYPFEKFFNAISGMATSERPLRDRIVGAHTSFVAVNEKDFKDPDAKREYQELMRRLTKVQHPEKGSVWASLQAMSDDEVEKTADLIVSILHHLILAGDT